jgi:hypothetical protein
MKSVFVYPWQTAFILKFVFFNSYAKTTVYIFKADFEEILINPASAGLRFAQFVLHWLNPDLLPYLKSPTSLIKLETFCFHPLCSGKSVAPPPSIAGPIFFVKIIQARNFGPEAKLRHGVHSNYIIVCVYREIFPYFRYNV